MIDRVGIIGVGHLASYLVEGINHTSPKMEIILSPRNKDHAKRLARKFGAFIAKNNQEVADKTNMVILSTRPNDSAKVAADIKFHQNHVLISVAAGLAIDQLKPFVGPATIIRAMPLSSSAINISPTLMFPDHPQVRSLFQLVGDVLIVPKESIFTPASAIAAFYGWLYALMDEAISWTVQEGVPYAIARKLILKTVYSAVGMSLAQSEHSMSLILESLATKGGITEQGLLILKEENGLKAWSNALQAVLNKLHKN